MLDHVSLDRIGRKLKSIYGDTAQAELPDHLQRLLAELERAEERLAASEQASTDIREPRRAAAGALNR